MDKVIVHNNSLCLSIYLFVFPERDGQRTGRAARGSTEVVGLLPCRTTMADKTALTDRSDDDNDDR